jgi:hypothetical protein
MVVGRRPRALGDGVGQAAGGVVNRDDQLADHMPVGKGQEPLAVLGPAVGDTAGQEAFVHGPDIAQHIPDVLGGCLDHNLVPDGGHEAGSSSLRNYGRTGPRPP